MPQAIRSEAVRRVYLFGYVRVEEAQNLLRLPAGSVRELFVYLILHAERNVTRARAAAALWPDSAPDRRRRRFSDTLYRLRQALGDTWFAIEGDRIQLVPAPALWVDVWAFAAALDSGTERDLAAAVALYRGDLAPEIHGDWLLPRRVLWREAAHDALLRLGQAALDAGQFEAAERHFSRLAVADPLREEGQRGLMRALAGLGRLDGALAVYSRFAQHLAGELGTAPMPATRDLADQLRFEQATQRQAAAQARTAPFVGRAAERARLLARLDRAQAGTGGFLVLLGEAGMGKTRLLQTLRESAGWRGWQVIYGRADEFGLSAPYAPLPDLLTAALPPPRVQQMAQLLAPHWLRLLGRIVPALAKRELAAEDDPRQPQRQLAYALGRLLAALTEIAPHLLILDDVQWADPALWPLLTELQATCADIPVLIVVSGRREGLREPALLAIQRWEAAGAPVMPLPPLDLAALQSLATAMGQADYAKDALRRLHAESGGNPLLALALMATPDVVAADHEATLDALMQARLARLSAPAQLALQAAAVLGFQFDYGLWSRLTPGLPETEMPAVAGELERSRLIQLAGDGYQFIHDTFRAHVHAGIPAGRRVELHATALAQLVTGGDANTLTLLGHAQGASDKTATARYALAAGVASRHAFAYAAAVDHFSLALSVLPETAVADRYRACRGRLRAHDSLGERKAQAADSVALRALAEQLGDLDYLAEAGFYQADYYWKVGDQAAALDLAQEALAQATAAGAASLTADLLNLLGRIARNQGDYDGAARYLRQARAAYESIGDHFGAAQSLDKLANLRYERGDYEGAAADHAAAADAMRALGQPRHEAHALSGLALVARALGDYDRALTLHRQVIAIGEEMDDRETQWVEQVNLGNIAYEWGDFNTACRWYEAALPIILDLNDPYGEALVRFNLGEARREQGNHEAAREQYDAVMALCQARAFRRGEGNVFFSLGLVALAEAAPEEAVAQLMAAQAIWEELGQGAKLMETEAALAQARLRLGQVDQAGALIEAALAALGPQQKATHSWRWLHFVAYQVREAQGRLEAALDHLREAAGAVDALAAKLPAAAQAGFRQMVPLNRAIGAALGALTQTVTARLVRTEVPLGRPLLDADYKTVTWTVASPLDEAVSGRTNRRRQVLTRLLTEAAAQGTAPTDRDLADVLGVSTRTVERDLAALRAAGQALSTRRRRA